jgi:hypothetical protein
MFYVNKFKNRFKVSIKNADNDQEYGDKPIKAEELLFLYNVVE